jgi:hypothetical protein
VHVHTWGCGSRKGSKTPSNFKQHMLKNKGRPHSNIADSLLINFSSKERDVNILLFCVIVYETKRKEKKSK